VLLDRIFEAFIEVLNFRMFQLSFKVLPFTHFYQPQMSKYIYTHIYSVHYRLGSVRLLNVFEKSLTNASHLFDHK